VRRPPSSSPLGMYWAMPWSGRVVVRLVFGQGCCAGAPHRELACGRGALGAGCRRPGSQTVFMRGAWAAVRKIRVPVAWKAASNEAVKFDPRLRIRNVTSSNRSAKLRERLRACCTVHAPVGLAVTPPMCIRRVPCSTTRPGSTTTGMPSLRTFPDPPGLGNLALPHRQWPERARLQLGTQVIQEPGHLDALPDRGGRQAVHAWSVRPGVARDPDERHGCGASARRRREAGELEDGDHVVPFLDGDGDQQPDPHQREAGSPG
jgi:hypothetical protein